MLLKMKEKLIQKYQIQNYTRIWFSINDVKNTKICKSKRMDCLKVYKYFENRDLLVNRSNELSEKVVCE